MEFQKCFVPVKTQESVPACNLAGIHHLTVSITDSSPLSGVCDVLKGKVSVLWVCVLTTSDRWELCFLHTKSSYLWKDPPPPTTIGWETSNPDIKLWSVLYHFLVQIWMTPQIMWLEVQRCAVSFLSNHTYYFSLADKMGEKIYWGYRNITWSTTK